MSAQAGTAPRPPLLRAPAVAQRLPAALESDWFYAGLLGAVLAWVAVRANGGLRVGSTTAVEIAVDLLAGAVAVAAVLVVPSIRRRTAGTAAGALFGLLVVATA